MYLWLRKRLPGGQSLVSPLLLPPPAPPCAGRLNHGPKHCHVLSCTRHKLRSRSSVRGGEGRCVQDSWREVDGVRAQRSSAWGYMSGRTVRWGRARVRTLREWFARYRYSTDIATQQASDGTESNGMGMSEV